MQNILIVGGAGYIGSHVAKLLKKSGYNPVVLDDLSTGHKQAVQFGSFYEGSYGNTVFVEEILRKEKITTVMHFGAKALVGESIENPLYYYSENVGCTAGLLQAMKSVGVNQFIFSSTCATFGEPSEVPIHEKVTQNPVNPYGQSKLFVELMLKDIDKAYGFRSAILRYFNASGADPEGILGEDHRPETHLIPRILKVALGIEPKLTVFGTDYPTKDGSCIRDYVHVNDLALAHIKAMRYLQENKKSCDFNLGTENGYSVLEIINAAQEVTGKKIEYSVGPRRSGDPATLVADARKAFKELDWKPTYTLKEVLEHAWNWFQKHPEGYES